jgi:UDP-N-acetylglucosamine 1-carboxyvinyltransferase
MDARLPDTLFIKGGARLRGEIEVAGGRAAALPLLAAAVLAPGRSQLRLVPDVEDLRACERQLEGLGAVVERRAGTVSVDTAALAPALIRANDSSSGGDDGGDDSGMLLLAALLGRCGQARLAGPPAATLRGWAPHFRGLQALGASISVDAGGVTAWVQRLRGGTVTFPRPSASATATVMLAAALAPGRSTLEGCACDPEVEELGRVLNKMGARVLGAGTPVVSLEGVDELAPFAHALPPDRLETGVLLVAAAITRGNLLLRHCAPEPLAAVLAKLRASGVQISVEGDGLRVIGGELRPADIVARPHPGFPAGMLPAFTALMTRAGGRSVLSEEQQGPGDRPDPAPHDLAEDLAGDLPHLNELARLGADVAREGRLVLVRGPSRLKGGRVELAAGEGPEAAAALVLAALAAEGTTEILRVSELDRGYERLDRKLRAAGADVRRVRGGTQRLAENTS